MRTAKGDIERIQNLLEQNKKRLQREFEQWFVQLREVADPRKLTDGEAASLVGAESGGYPVGPAGGTQDAPLMGDATVDADIRAYYDARRALG